MLLSLGQARVVGALMEKQLTTPQSYPLTVNALAGACNQSSNRDPVVEYAEDYLIALLGELRDLRLVRFVLPSHGRSVVRYRQVLDEVFGLDDRQMAVVALLLLRGPQTLAEVRARTERMAVFTDLAEVEHDLEGLAGGADPLVGRRSRRPGQKEERWAQLLCPSPPPQSPHPSPVPTGVEHPPGDSPAAVSEAPRGRSGTDDLLQAAVADLQAEVADLRAEVGDLQAEVGDLRSGVADLQKLVSGLGAELDGFRTGSGGGGRPDGP